MSGNEKTDRIALLFERYAPFMTAIVLSSVLYVYRNEIVAGSVNDTLDFSALYSAVFDWSAIQTGFLFAIFGFIAGKNNGFIKEIQETPQMGYFHQYQKTAIFLGFMLTFGSIFLMVINLKISEVASWQYIVFCIWSSLSIWAFFAFVRVAYIFGIIIRVRDRSRVRG